MTAALVVSLLFAFLGVLALLYALHFRRRALLMGDERLRAALSRTVSGEEGAGEEELRRGARELDARMRGANLAIAGLLAAALAACLALVALSALPWLSLMLCGVSLLLLSLYIAVALLRDIPRRACQAPHPSRGARG